MLPPIPADEHPLRATGIFKGYGGRPILSGIDLKVTRGSSFALLGLNGAGKTTLIKCLLDLCSIDRGSISIFGIDHASSSARSRLAFVPERFVPPHYLTCREFIDLTFSLGGDQYEKDRVAQLFDDLGLELSVMSRPVGQLSKGMTQKLGLAACLLISRDLYILDEPMSGLDPVSRIAVKSVLARLNGEGRTLFFTSHVLTDVEELCSSIAVMHHGEIRFRGTPKELCVQTGQTKLEEAFMRCLDDAEPEIAGRR